jgi:hypothetical protein
VTEKTVLDFVPALIGFSAVAVGWWVTHRSAVRAREVEALREQLRSLYGPLHFLTSQNGELWKLHEKVDAARAKFFEGRKGDLAPESIEAFSKAHLKTIDLKNTYAQRGIENNKRIMELLEKNWHLIDAGDVGAMAEFQVDYIRYSVESRENTADIPLNVLMELGSVVVGRENLRNCAKASFERKRARLTKLTGVSEGV